MYWKTPMITTIHKKETASEELSEFLFNEIFLTVL